MTMSARRWPRLAIFFFQAEDGIRDVAVTGVQTCALPISTDGCAAYGPGRGGVQRHSSPESALSARDQRWQRAELVLQQSAADAPERDGAGRGRVARLRGGGDVELDVRCGRGEPRPEYH